MASGRWLSWNLQFTFPFPYKCYKSDLVKFGSVLLRKELDIFIQVWLSITFKRMSWIHVNCWIGTNSKRYTDWIRWPKQLDVHVPELAKAVYIQVTLLWAFLCQSLWLNKCPWPWFFRWWCSKYFITWNVYNISR